MSFQSFSIFIFYLPKNGSSLYSLYSALNPDQGATLFDLNITKTVPESMTGIRGILLPQNLPSCFEDCDIPSRTCHKTKFYLLTVYKSKQS